MSQKCGKKLVLLKTFYYRSQTQDGLDNANSTEFITNPLTSTRSSIRRMTDKNFYPIKNEFIEFTTIIIKANNPISGITKQIFQQTFMIKTKCGFLSANTFYLDSSSSWLVTTPVINYPVTSASGDLKNAVQVTIETDNDGNIFSNGAKFARRVKVYGYK